METKEVLSLRNKIEGIHVMDKLNYVNELTEVNEEENSIILRKSLLQLNSNTIDI